MPAFMQVAGSVTESPAVELERLLADLAGDAVRLAPGDAAARRGRVRPLEAGLEVAARGELVRGVVAPLRERLAQRGVVARVGLDERGVGARGRDDGERGGEQGGPG